MNTILFYAAVLVSALILLLFVPGVSTMVKPIVDGIGKGVLAVLGAKWAWVIWIVKIIWRSHVDLIRHLVLPEHKLDPTRRYRS
ncbi:hypothetical protein [Thioalkalivibrio thiocyanodenitrificans]|uniref:hypothetical protein n=1 Tax=Thioalkalivibrio thiocyanodenitrificans TaxID=243063 RepID=UPI000371DBC4|nr:hypothetical protein [Thioalkalivibrio thiocyanodenitrificans]